MLGTVDILKKIKEVDGNLPLKVKNINTGDVLNFDYNYVANEILFLFASKDGKGTCDNYLKQLKHESYDECWESYAYANENVSPDEIEDWDGDIDKAKYEVVTGLDTRVYLGNQDECPIKCFEESFEIVDIEVTNDALILLYKN